MSGSRGKYRTHVLFHIEIKVHVRQLHTHTHTCTMQTHSCTCIQSSHHSDITSKSIFLLPGCDPIPQQTQSI